MKNYIASTIVATGLIILVFAMDASGQAVSRVIADIPFDFFVGKQKLPSGRYEFEPANKQVAVGPVIVRSLTAPERDSVIVPAINGESTETTLVHGVIFARYGSVHYLSQIKMDPGTALSLLKTGDERRIARLSPRSRPIIIAPAVGKGN